MRGANHPQYRHGAAAERSVKLAEPKKLEQVSFALGLATGARWRGLGREPKPKRG
jgi:hypothetical protein